LARIKTIIIGAAGRDFHNFNTVYRDNENYDVLAFTATQIPYINDRKYPAELAGKLYPKGIPIYDESELESLIKKYKVEQCVFSYSDVSHETVMHLASRCNAAGSDFVLISAEKTMVKSTKPVIAVCAIRTGSGKSQTSRAICASLKKMGKKVVAVRHPMPYGDLVKQAVQRFATYEDMKKHKCTIEEMEEYEPYTSRGMVIYAGVDYEKILRQAEKEADIIIWDGGNNDTSFYKPDMYVVVFDPLRAGHELKYHPGEINARMCDVAVINKEDSAKKEDIELVKKNIKQMAPKAIVIDAESPLLVSNPELIKGKKVLVIEDGPTLTHGGMKIGAGIVAAKQFNATPVDPRNYAVGTIKETFEKYPGIGILLPAMGYSDQQIKDLEETINKVPCDAVIIGTPIDLTKLVKIKKPAVRVEYNLKEISKPTLEELLKKKFS